MELLKLAGVFCVMILVLWRKKPLSWAVAAAALAVWLLFWMPARTFAAALVRGAVRWDTIQLLLVLYLITFLQRMLEKRGCLTSAKDALDAAGVSAVRRWVELAVDCPYSFLERVKLACAALGGAVGDIEYAAAVTVHVLLPGGSAERFQAQMTELSAGNFSAVELGEVFRAAPLG